MKILFDFLFVLLMLFALTLSAADRLGVAEPVGKGGVSASEIEAFWGMLESSADGGYEIVSRSALKQILTEMGLTESSGLVNPSSAQKSKLGEIKTVKYLLVSTIGKFGRRLNVSLMVMDSSTGTIDPEKKTSETVDSLDDLADKLPDMLNEIGLGMKARKRGISALLSPVVTVRGAPEYLAGDFASSFESVLLSGKVKLRGMNSISKILRKNGIGALNEAEPAMFVRVGKLLRVDALVQPTLTRFEFNVKKEYIRASKRSVVRCIGTFEGNIRIVSAQTGELVSSFPFRVRIDFDDLDPATTEDWSGADYGKYLIDRVVPEIAKPVIQAIR